MKKGGEKYIIKLCMLLTQASVLFCTISPEEPNVFNKAINYVDVVRSGLKVFLKLKDILNVDPIQIFKNTVTFSGI